MKKLHLIVEIPPSVNHCYHNVRVNGRRGRALTDEAAAWKAVAGFVAKNALRHSNWRVPAADEKVIMEVTAYWPTNQRRDMNNCHKLLCDAFEKILYEDDKMVLVRDMDFCVDRKHPRFEVDIYIKE